MIKLKDYILLVDRFIIAHRGASELLPENSLIAFQEAINQDVDMIELDVRITVDNIPVAFHDDDLNDFGQPLKISELKYSDLRKVKLIDPRINKPFNISALEEFIVLAKKTRRFLTLELKSNFSEDDKEKADLVYSLVKKYDFLPFTLFASFDTMLIKYLKDTYSDTHVAKIKIPEEETLPSEIKIKTGAEAYICSISDLDNNLVSDALQSDVYIGAYSVSNIDDLKLIQSYGIKAIVCNNPKLIKSLLATGN